MSKALTVIINDDDQISIKLPEDLEYLSDLQSAFYLFAYRMVDGDDRVVKLAEELIEEYNNKMEKMGGSVH